MPLERRQVIGAAAVVVLGLAAWTFWPSTPVPTATVQAPARVRGGRAIAAPVENGPVAPVKLKALSGTRDEPGEASRNPFRFQPKVVVPPPRPSGVSEAPPQPIIPVQTGPPPAPPLPPIPLKFIGLLTRADGTKWAALSDGKSPSPFYGKDGDIIDGRYLIVKIGTESIEMTYTSGSGRQVIRLTGQ